MEFAASLANTLSIPGFWGTLIGGVLFGVIAGLIPGISGRVSLLLALPVALWFDPLGAAVFLVAMHAVVHTTGSVPAVLLGLPTSSSQAATILDGYPLMKQNRGGEAVGVTLGASALGGVIGALALILLLPVGRQLASHFGSPEVAALSTAGLLAIAALSGKSVALGLVVAALGVLAASVGLDALTGAPRYTFGLLDLWDGVHIAAVVAGIFVIPEMLRARPATTVATGELAVRLRHVLQGTAHAIRHFWLTFRCAVLGIVVGFIPGLGASVVVWMAYGHASATTRPKVPFGEGAVEGIIAPESANNSKEGGALLPTLLFAVPGTSSMGILLGAFALIGIEVGPAMAVRDPGLIQTLGWVVLLANVIALPICLGLAPFLTRFAAMHRGLVIPFALMASVTAALAVSPSLITLGQIILFGAIGVVLMHLNWPRAPFVLGFVIGPILESALNRTVMAYGTEAFFRPVVMAVLGLTVLALIVSKLRSKGESIGEGSAPRSSPPTYALLVALFAVMGATAWSFPVTAWLLPVLVCAVGLAATLVAWVGRFDPSAHWPQPNGATLVLFSGFLLTIWLAGPVMAAMIFALAAFSTVARVSFYLLPLVVVGFGLFAWSLVGEPVGVVRPVSTLLFHFAIN